MPKEPPPPPVSSPDSPSQPQQPSPPHESPQTYSRTPLTSPRSLHQLSIYILGSTLLLASTALTRKAIYRRTLRLKPSYFSPNTNPHEYFSPFADAIQALNLATMNCVSVGVMALGGAMWTFDISGLREAQGVLRRRLGYERIYAREEDVPRGLGELIAASGEMRVVEDGEEREDEEKGNDKS